MPCAMGRTLLFLNRPAPYGGIAGRSARVKQVGHGWLRAAAAGMPANDEGPGRRGAVGPSLAELYTGGRPVVGVGGGDGKGGPGSGGSLGLPDPCLPIFKILSVSL